MKKIFLNIILKLNNTVDIQRCKLVKIINLVEHTMVKIKENENHLQ